MAIELKKVVVTGMGALTPIGNDLKSYEEALFAGTSGAAMIEQFDCSKFRTRFACEVKGFDVNDLVGRKDARKMDKFTHFAIAAADEAIAHSKILENESIDKKRIGVIWASGIGGLEFYQSELERYYTGGSESENHRFNPFFIPKMIIDIAAGHISIRHGLRGLNFGVVSACASATNALIDATTYIQLGKADAIVAGGSDSTINVSGIGGFGGMKALSTRNDDPSTASRPFDLDRDGFVMGEGAGALILESEEHALARGANILAEIVGYGMSADAYHLTAPHPEGFGARDVMINALEDANLNPEQIDYINVHGTSTPLGDIAESKAIEAVFGDHATKLNISSTKSMTGHLLGAAGAIETIACILATQKDRIPPTINHSTPDPAFNPELNFTFNKAQDRTVDYALSNTFGFGGHNASVIVKKYSK